MSFRAGVQYGDFGGTAAADRANDHDLADFLRGRGLMHAGEFLLAVELSVGENHGGVVAEPYVRALVAAAKNYEEAVAVAKSDPVPVRIVDVPVGISEFIGFFKRFAVTLTLSGADLDSKQYSAN